MLRLNIHSLTHDYHQHVNTAASTFPPYTAAHGGCGPYSPYFLCSPEACMAANEV
jgi:hypothetical protein